MERGQNFRGKKPAGSGRKKGSQNKIAVNLKTAIEEAFDRLGGVTWLVKLARKDPAAFCSLLGRLIPKQIEQSGSIDVNVLQDRLESAKKRASGGDVVRPEFQKEAC
jgi:hypothetical protein